MANTVKFSSARERDEYIANRVKERQPEIDAAAPKAARVAVSKAVAGARAKGSVARAIKASNSPLADTLAAKKADADCAAAARAMLLRNHRTPVPNKDAIQEATGSALPFAKLSDHDQVKAILKAQRGQR